MPKGRPPHQDPPVQITVSLPRSLLARLNKQISPPGRDSPTYGTRSRLIARLIKWWLNGR